MFFTQINLQAMNDNFQSFFTFIGKNAQTRLVGWTTATILFLGVVVYSQWNQHLQDDKKILDSKNAEIDRLIKSGNYKDERYNQLSTDYLDYIKTVTQRNDSIAADNQRFLNELKKK